MENAQKKRIGARLTKQPKMAEESVKLPLVEEGGSVIPSKEETAIAAKPVVAVKTNGFEKDKIAKAMTLKELDEKSLMELRNIAEKLNISKANLYNIYKELRQTGLLIKDEINSKYRYEYMYYPEFTFRFKEESNV